MVVVTDQAVPRPRIGEKMVVWSHVTPTLQEILDNVSLYWFTGCYPSSIWIYRAVSSTTDTPRVVLPVVQMSVGNISQLTDRGDVAAQCRHKGSLEAMGFR